MLVIQNKERQNKFAYDKTRVLHFSDYHRLIDQC